MDEMEENGLEPNEVTYSVMIEAYCKGKKSGEAHNVLDDMLGKNHVPSSALCCRVVDMLCKEWNVENACEVWRKLLRMNCSRDDAVTGTLVHWLCKKGKVIEARKALDEFGGGVVPSLLTYNTLIAGMRERGELCEAARLWDDMVEKGRVPNAFTYDMLIKGFCKVGNVKEGIRIIEEMFESGCLPDKSTYTVLIDGLSCARGMVEEINKVVALAVSAGVDDDMWDIFLKSVVNNLNLNAAEFDRILCTFPSDLSTENSLSTVKEMKGAYGAMKLCLFAIMKVIGYPLPVLTPNEGAVKDLEDSGDSEQDVDGETNQDEHRES
ncbi:pentatricopeptide repeat-containing protein At5g16420, mitochondrial-like [Arachis ipaensis]|uniref:pentatricopeptide repeat-containing protein At5g16420, mitochondrial-like n=1 Tax=Arachis ipaensis TaxID=130454 RepID=UPI000A2B25D3|nr:pentatricopeptide repeat-containing protein At5g16420, mitochondrial-like [Arachis ipaensis]